MNNFDDGTGRRIVSDASGLNAFMTRVYGIMGIAVLISALSAYLFAAVAPQFDSGVSGIVLILVWFVLAMIISAVAFTNPMLAFIGLIAFSVITGITMSDIFAIFSLGTIASAFVASASLFIVMSLIGLTTHKNLTKWGTQAFAALIALLVAMIINIFLGNPLIELFISCAGVIIFTILSASDTQNLKNMYENYAGEVNINGLAINGVLQLYINFLNLFEFILEIFGFAGNNR